MPDDFAGPKLKLGSDLGSQRFRQIAHRLKAFGSSLKDPLADLGGAKSRLAALGEPGFQRFPRFGVEQVSHFCIIQPSRIRQVFNPPMTNRKLPATAKAMVAELDA